MTEQAPLVSVCVMAYQHASYISQCLDSVVEQQVVFPFEIILGEDDSDDGTREICIEYAARFPQLIRLFLRSGKDKIFVDGQKTGRFNFIENIKAARGRYICLLDGDDYWINPKKLQMQVDLMESDPGCSMCFHKSLQCTGHSSPRVLIKPLEGEDQVFTIEELMAKTGVFSLHTSNTMFRKKNLEEIPQWFYVVPFLDVPLFVYAGATGQVRYIPEEMSVYRLHREGMWFSSQEPVNYRKQWRMFTILASHTKGRLREVMLERRQKLGRQLIQFYKRHLWMDSYWLREELEKGVYKGDDELYTVLMQPPGIGNYLYNVAAYSKKIAKGLGKK